MRGHGDIVGGMGDDETNAILANPIPRHVSRPINRAFGVVSDNHKPMSFLDLHHACNSCMAMQ